MLGYFAPFLPAMETPQIIRPHDPDKSDTGAAGQQPRYRIVGISRLNDSFETRDIDPGVMRKGAGSGNSLRQRREPARILERISGCDQPPDAIKLESLEREQGCAEMRLMRRIERPPKQTNSHAGRVRGQQALRIERVFWISRPGLTAPVDAVLEGGELVDSDRPARVQAAGGNADLCAETEFAAVGELRRRIVQHDRRIDFAQEPLGRLRRSSVTMASV